MPLQLTYKRGDKFRHTVEHRGCDYIPLKQALGRPISHVGGRKAHTRGCKLRSPKVHIAPERVMLTSQDREAVLRHETKGLRLQLRTGHPGLYRPAQLLGRARAASGLHMQHTRRVQIMVRARGLVLAHLGYSASAHA